MSELDHTAWTFVVRVWMEPGAGDGGLRGQITALDGSKGQSFADLTQLPDLIGKRIGVPAGRTGGADEAPPP
jgi:hypothetical protein